MTYHTYEFLKRRKNSPKWRKVYTSAKNKRIVDALVTINIIVWGLVLWKKVESGSVKVNDIIDILKSKINEFLN